MHLVLKVLFLVVCLLPDKAKLNCLLAVVGYCTKLSM